MNERLVAALTLHRWGITVLPCAPRTKHPLVKWEPYQGIKQVTEADLFTWFDNDEPRNLWILCGPKSGVIVVDLDGPDTLRWLRTRLSDIDLKIVPRVRTSKGWHLYFAWTEGAQQWHYDGLYLGMALNIDVRNGDKGGVVAPPSQHDKTDHIYSWEVLPELNAAGRPGWPALPAALYSRQGAGLAPIASAGATTTGRSQYAQLLANPPTEGGRNVWLAQAAGHLAKLHHPHRDAYDIEFDRLVRDHIPDLPAEEVEKTRESIWRAEDKKPPVDPGVAQGGVARYTDGMNAERLIKRHGTKIRFVSQWTTHVVYDGRRWELDRGDARMLQFARDVRFDLIDELRELRDDSAFKAATAAIKSADQAATLRAMVGLVRAIPGVRVELTDLDADPWLLNCGNGTIDLRTGQLGPHQSADMLTRVTQADYRPDAPRPAFELMLARIQPDPEIRSFIQRLLGSALVGRVRDEILPVFHGTGANGKSKLIHGVRFALGDYAHTGARTLLMQARFEAHPTELADLYGTRLVTVVETNESGRLDEEKVKHLTGADEIKARRMREDFWSFWPSHTLLLVTNHKPIVRGTDTAIWRRLILIPFDVTIPESEWDRDLAVKLEAEAEGILAWLVAGCVEYQRSGLSVPATVAQSTQQYRQQQDQWARFMDEMGYEYDRAKATLSAVLTADYHKWTTAENEYSMSANAVGERLRRDGCTSKKTHGVKSWVGIGAAQPTSGRLPPDVASRAAYSTERN